MLPATPDIAARKVVEPSAAERPGFIAGIRAMASALVSRGKLVSSGGGLTFDGKRDVTEALGYVKDISNANYRLRYDRNEIAARVIEAYPIATWRGGGELVEDDDPENVTPFEEAFFTLADRLQMWPRLLRADILSGLGRYAVVLIGAPGNLEDELPKLTAPEQVAFLSVFSEEDAEVEALDEDASSARFGRPTKYRVGRMVPAVSNAAQGSRSQDTRKTVHWSRCVHVCDGLLDDDVYGQPRLRRVWNRLDDLDKVVGGGSEAFWQRSQQGMQLDLDKEVTLDGDAKKALQDEVDEYMHGMRRVMRTQGVTVNPLGSDVANFGSQVDAILSLISGGTAIPQRILTGSEMGELASSQDKTNWDERVQDRRENFAGPHVVRQLVDRLIGAGALPTPALGYEVRWPVIDTLDIFARADVAVKLASANASNADVGGEIVTANEIRDLVLDLGPLEQDAAAQAAADGVVAASGRRAICLGALTSAKLRMRVVRMREAGVPDARLAAAVKKKGRGTLSVMPQTGTCGGRSGS